jgi:hypothetical protein
VVISGEYTGTVTPTAQSGQATITAGKAGPLPVHVAGPATCVSSTAPTAPGGTAVAYRGQVEYRTPNGPFVKLTPGTSITLPIGSIVQTGFKSGAAVDVAGRGVVTLGPMTYMVVEPHGLYLRMGNIDAALKPRQGRGSADFEVKTATVTASDRGTVFAVGYQSGATTISVSKDMVYVQPTNHRLHSLLLKAGYKVTVTRTRISPVARSH